MSLSWTMVANPTDLARAETEAVEPRLALELGRRDQILHIKIDSVCPVSVIIIPHWHAYLSAWIGQIEDCGSRRAESRANKTGSKGHRLELRTSAARASTSTIGAAAGWDGNPAHTHTLTH